MSEASGFMVTRNDHRFESIQQWFVFVNPEADIDPETSLPDDPQEDPGDSESIHTISLDLA